MWLGIEKCFNRLYFRFKFQRAIDKIYRATHNLMHFDRTASERTCEMKIFEIIENHFASVGLTASQSLQPQQFNVRNVTVLLIFGLNIFLTGAYIALTATEFEEYVDSLYGCSTVMNCSIVFASLILQMPKLFKFLIKLKRTVNKSKWNLCVWFGSFPMNNSSNYAF